MKKMKKFYQQFQIIFIMQRIFILVGMAIFIYGCDETQVPLNIEPSCTITSPNNDDEFDVFETIAIEVEADDNDGSITEVRFFIDDTAVGSSSSFPYTYQWENSSDGIHTIKATALDAEGGSTSSVVNVIVNPYGKVSDIDGNYYNFQKIGDQYWLTENLRTSTLNNGTPIENITTNSQWSNRKTPAFCWYNNDAATYDAPYGKLYNWYTIKTGNLCPTGWHVSTDDERTNLIDYLGGENLADDKLREEGTIHWISPNKGATNETGFTALPGGYRLYDGSFSSFGNYGIWWSSTVIASEEAYYWNVGLYTSVRGRGGWTNGKSVRCVRD